MHTSSGPLVESRSAMVSGPLTAFATASMAASAQAYVQPQQMPAVPSLRQRFASQEGKRGASFPHASVGSQKEAKIGACGTLIASLSLGAAVGWAHSKRNKASFSARQNSRVQCRAAAEARPLDDITRLDLRVGRITKVWPHPDADKLYCEEIDLGEEGGPRNIASGLRAHCTEEEMTDQLVVVLANLKARKMRGFKSEGMVMCASDEEGKVELLKVPEGAQVGERVTIEGYEMDEPDARLNEKTGKAPLPALADDLKTTANMEASYKGAVWQTSAGPVMASTVASGKIS